MAVDPKMKRGNGRPFPLETPIERERLFGSHLFGRCRRREHVHLDLAAGPLAERDDAVDGGEEGVVAADADILAGVHLGAALTDQDVARQDLLAAEAFYAQPLAR